MSKDEEAVYIGDYAETVSLNANEVAVVSLRGKITKFNLVQARLEIPLTEYYIKNNVDAWRANLVLILSESKKIALDANCVEGFILALQRCVACKS